MESPIPDHIVRSRPCFGETSLASTTTGAVSGTGIGIPDLLEAHRLVHELNGALLEAVDAAGGISLRVGSFGQPEPAPGIWTAVLRSDLDGHDGIFAMVSPAAMAWGMPEACLRARPGKSWDAAASDVIAALDAASAAGLPVKVRVTQESMVSLDGELAATAPGVFSSHRPLQAVKAPLSYRLF